jgi:hypothetical protein
LGRLNAADMRRSGTRSHGIRIGRDLPAEVGQRNAGTNLNILSLPTRQRGQPQ